MVTAEEHEKWFNDSLKNPGRVIYIGESENGSKAGMIKLDSKDSDIAEISINLAPEMRQYALSAL